ncbi:hypothetical protein PN36_14375 [Candidatus Thiomargarita nelsonii]|uniref:Uncharacterized protein n=1 Tax=Candidatus Thiomargarita nelsonii TaxID=1003181 RepID=A0A4E0QTF3_9GAMM|nr:hypothetical protein PN36_14375 [Candidatus Thiomargarita nelsonii]
MNHKFSDILESKALALDCCFFSHPKLKLWIPKNWKTYGSILSHQIRKFSKRLGNWQVCAYQPIFNTANAKKCSGLSLRLFHSRS